MACGTFKPKNTCAKVYGSCVSYEMELSQYTELDPDDCNSMEDVLQDTINIVDGIKDSMSFESLKGECITYPDVELSLIQVLQNMQDFMCQQNQTILEQQSDIDDMKAQIIELQNNICS